MSKLGPAAMAMFGLFVIMFSTMVVLFIDDVDTITCVEYDRGICDVWENDRIASFFTAGLLLVLGVCILFVALIAEMDILKLERGANERRGKQR